MTAALKKTSNEALERTLVFPLSAMLVTAALHFALGKKSGYPAVVWSEPIYDGALGERARARFGFPLSLSA